MVGEEVLQRVGAYGVFALLLDDIVMNREQLGRYRAVQHVVKRGLEQIVFRSRCNVGNGGPDLCFRHTDVHIVHGGVVSVIGAPAVDIL